MTQHELQQIPTQVASIGEKSEKKIRFSKWTANPLDLKMSINNMRARKYENGIAGVLGVPRRSVSVLSNHFSIRNTFESIARPFD